MPTAERFLSVAVDPPVSGTAWLVAECMDGQWWLYRLDRERKIIDAVPVASLESALVLAESTFGTDRSAWIEAPTQ